MKGKEIRKEKKKEKSDEKKVKQVSDYQREKSGKLEISTAPKK